MHTRTAPTQYINASNGVRFAYRRWGTPSSSGIPLLFHNHFRGNMDWWDPLLVDTIAAKRVVILFDGSGVGKTAGEVPANFQGWADDVVAFLAAMALERIDLFGYSMGARAAQQVALTKPALIRKMVLAGASPLMWTPDSSKDVRDPKYQMAMATANSYEESMEAFRHALFGESDIGRMYFEKYWNRLQQRTIEPPDLDALELEPGGKNQITAILSADKPENVRWPDRLAEMKMPVLVANGEDDLVLSTNRTLELWRRLPNAQLVLYPKSGHGFLWQYAELFGSQINLFLSSDAFDGST